MLRRSAADDSADTASRPVSRVADSGHDKGRTDGVSSSVSKTVRASAAYQQKIRGAYANIATTDGQVESSLVRFSGERAMPSVGALSA